MTPDSIGPWSEVKLDIIERYALEYSKILTNNNLHHIYIDGYAGGGEHEIRGEGRVVWGSPMRALQVQPQFREYHFIDISVKTITSLANLIYRDDSEGPVIELWQGDCTSRLLNLFPTIQWSQKKRALCLLDPFDFGVDWKVVSLAGRMGTIELFINFMIYDANMNILLHDRSKVTETQKARMDRVWGDRSWEEVVYRPTDDLFGAERKCTNEELVAAYRQRLIDVAGFPYVPEPLPMQTPEGQIVYYLFFTSPRPVAKKIVSYIFDKYRGNQKR